MKNWMVINEYRTGNVDAYEFKHLDNAEVCMTYYPSICRKVTLMQRTDVAEGSVWKTVYYIDKEGRHDLSE